MTSMMTSSVFVITCSMMTVQFAAAGLSDNVLDFMDTFNGIIDNNDLMEVPDFVLFQSKAKPVYVPALHKDAMIYDKTEVSGKQHTLTVASVTEDPKSGKIEVRYYNITNNKQYRFDTFNTDELNNYSLASFTPFPQRCNRLFSKVSTGNYKGVFGNCKELGQSDTMTDEVSCDSMTLTEHFNSPKKSDTTSVFKRRGQKYPLLGVRAGYIAPCTNRK